MGRIQRLRNGLMDEQTSNVWPGQQKALFSVLRGGTFMHTLHYLNHHHHPGSSHLLKKHFQNTYTHMQLENKQDSEHSITVACHMFG